MVWTRDCSPDGRQERINVNRRLRSVGSRNHGLHRSGVLRGDGQHPQACVRAPRHRGTVVAHDGLTEMKVLSFAAVEGREWWTRFAWSALALLALAAPAAAQHDTTFVDLAPDLASKIADAIPSGATLHLAFPSDDTEMHGEVARLLAARGVRIVDGGDATPVRASCHSNLRERVCAA